jgi:RimJ/RimL family protein N-acetyltransferase
MITTPRLVLRTWRESDLPAFAELNADPEVMRHFPSTLSAVESDALARRVMSALDVDGIGWFAVEVPGVAPFIGFVGMKTVPDAVAAIIAPGESPPLEVGWRLARGAWGQGFATEAARGVLAWAARTRGVERAVSFTATTNVRSEAVMRRIGFERDLDGDFDHPSVPEGSPIRRHVLYRGDLRRLFGAGH